MELSRSDYPALLGALQPGQAIAVLRERIKTIEKTHADIADWLQERRRVEELYVQGLRKLAQRQHRDSAVELGIFQLPWHRIVSSTEAIAHAHADLANKIEADVERPLREFAMRDKEMQNMSTIQGNLASIAKDVETAQRKADKLKGKGAATGKLASANSGVENASQEWDSQAPYVFEQLQALDETRLNHLRDVLTQFLTHEIDEVGRSRAAHEECLNLLLNVKTEDEIKTFVLKTSGGKAPSSRKTSHSTAGGLRPPPMSSHSHSNEDHVSEMSGPSSKGSPSIHHSGFSGLKRLGTVMGRRKNSALSTRPSSPNKKNHRPLFSRGDSSRQPIPSPAASTQNLSIQPSPQQDAVAPTPELPPVQATPQDSNTQEEAKASEEYPPERKAVNGIGAAGEASNAFGISETKPSANAAKNPSSPTKDTEGFNIRPDTIDDITRAQQEAASSEHEGPLFKFDIRDEPIKEENDGDAKVAFDNVANTLRQAQLSAPTRRTSTLRGRRDVRNTIYIPNPQPPPENPVTESSPPPPSPFRRPSALAAEDHPGSDAQSIRSSHSLGSATGAAVKHADMNFPGLNASIVETASAWFKNGEVIKATLIGELALAFNRPDPNAPFGNDSIRLENFEALEKVAPNPAFISKIPDRPGEYDLELVHVARPNVAFKYQVHVEDSDLASYAPVFLKASWKVEPTQISLIIAYTPNLSFITTENSSILIKNLLIIVTLDGTKTTKCQSKPVGTFSKEKSLIYWKLGDVTLSKDNSTSQKLVARFSTESEAKPGHVEARWEISGEQAAIAGSGLAVSHSVLGSNGTVKEEGTDPFADEGTSHNAPSGHEWIIVPTARKLISGKYLCQ
ncbi:MAG: hypothetical protein M1834_000855 [Cirrosporium novae-zelandiae]|nr:MAG: hypothetical protein M1834_000855 [Cirrosporium novae-zelandiae]